MSKILVRPLTFELFNALRIYLIPKANKFLGTLPIAVKTVLIHSSVSLFTIPFKI